MSIPRLILCCVTCALLSSALPAQETQILKLGTSAAQVMAVKVTVSNLRQSYDFYTKVIGLKEVDIPGLPKAVLNDPDIAYTDAKLNFTGSGADPWIVLMKSKGGVPDPEHAKQVWLNLKVADVRAVVARAKQMGVTVQLEPQPFMGAVVSLLNDPDGYVVEVFESPNLDVPAADHSSAENCKRR